MFRVLFLSVFSLVQAVDFQIINKESGPIWVGIQGNSGKPALENGGFILDSKASVWYFNIFKKIYSLWSAYPAVLFVLDLFPVSLPQ